MLSARRDEAMRKVNDSTGLLEEDSLIGALYRAHGPALFAFLRQHAATRSDAEDLLLDVFVTALEYERLADLTDTGRLAWLWRVARNKAIDHYRRNARRPTLGLEQVEARLFDDEDGSPERAALRQDEFERLHASLQELTPLQRDVLRLRFAEDLRCGEIALALGKKESAVRVLLMRTLRFLRTLYAAQDVKD
jgi:RNA polymerase sigma factor (sigma-70 family)